MKFRSTAAIAVLSATAIAAFAALSTPSAAEEKKAQPRDYGVTESERRTGDPMLLGAFVYSQRCSVCHDRKSGGLTKFGPHLEGIVGRKAAATGWSKHTDAVKGSDMVWTEEALNKLLTEPQEALPGVNMTTIVRFRRSRKALIAYMKTL